MKLSLVHIASLAILFCFVSTGIFFYSQGKKEITPVEQKKVSEIKPSQPPSGGSPVHIFEIEPTEDVQTTFDVPAGVQKPPEIVSQPPQEQIKTETVTQQSLHVYANILAPNIVDLYTIVQNNYATFIALATTTPPKNISDAVMKLADIYQNTAININVLASPPQTPLYQNALVSNYKIISSALRDLATAAQKGETSITAMQNYNIGVASSTEALIGIANTIKKEGVVFTSTESGYFFVEIIP